MGRKPSVDVEKVRELRDSGTGGSAIANWDRTSECLSGITGLGTMQKTKRQDTGDLGEAIVEKYCLCPKCKASTKTLKRLPPNFKCADIICDFCGFLAQVKTKRAEDIETIDNQIAGAGWAPQKARMDAGIYFPLYFVKVSDDGKKFSVFYLPADYQSPEIFVPSIRNIKNRKPYEMFNYRLDDIKASMVRVI